MDSILNHRNEVAHPKLSDDPTIGARIQQLKLSDKMITNLESYKASGGTLHAEDDLVLLILQRSKDIAGVGRLNLLNNVK